MSEEKNNRCFVIMPFSTPKGYEENHFTKIYEQIIKPAVEKADLVPERVDENLLSTDIVTKIFKGLTECDMAICDLSSRNPNVLYELGIRQAYNKPVLLIKDEKTEKIFDVGGLTTIPYESNRLYENVTDAVERIAQALKEHLSNQEGVVDIIRGRLDDEFKASKIPTGKNMNKDDKIISLLLSLTEDMDSIKRRINRDNDARIINRVDEEACRHVRENLLMIRHRLKMMSAENSKNEDIKSMIQKCDYFIHLPMSVFISEIKDIVEFVNQVNTIIK